MNDKKQKKPMPEYWYKGQPIKDDEALIEALIKDGKLEIKKNITLYELHEDVCEACECAWEFDFGQAVDDTKCLVEELDEDEDLCGIKSIAYKDGKGRFSCPKMLLYQFEEDFKLKLSSECCLNLKKKPAHKWEKANNRPIAIIGIRMEEGGQRKNHKGCIIVKGGKLTRFKPLNPVSDAFEDWFIAKYQIKLCKLYYPPYNFKRTGCKGCPFSLDLQEQLTTMRLYMPAEREQCEIIWKPVYEEYRRIGFRLDQIEQLKLF